MDFRSVNISCHLVWICVAERMCDVLAAVRQVSLTTVGGSSPVAAGAGRDYVVTDERGLITV